MASAFYEKLQKDLVIARKITYNVPNNTCNTVIQELKIKSFIFLSHAVLEEYLESIVLDTAEKAIRNHADSGKICTALVGLISSGLIARMEELGITKKAKKQPFENISLFASSAYGRFKYLVENNHGIKTENQENLLLPVGIDPSTEDPVTLAALDSFGGKRGAIAHQFKIAKSHTLSEIDSDLQTISTGLLNYDSACLQALN